MKTSILILLFALAVWLAPAHAGVIGLSPQPGSGGLFDVVVNASNVFATPHQDDPLLAYGFDVNFNSATVSYLGETAGPLFADLSGQPGLMAQVAGVAANILLSPGDFTEPLVLATLHFSTLAPGPIQIGITGDPANLDQGLIYLSGSDEILAGISIPEPGTYLSGIALFAILAIRRSRFFPRFR
ncbi:MAG TPA: hypothetical protein VG672_24770 [Bryobacteraceae bacterium]|nr:hypothetical protein [Bryobacteraceae bacterium]